MEKKVGRRRHWQGLKAAMEMDPPPSSLANFGKGKFRGNPENFQGKCRFPGSSGCDPFGCFLSVTFFISGENVGNGKICFDNLARLMTPEDFRNDLGNYGLRFGC